MAIRTIKWMVSEDGTTVSPTTCMDGGVQGDHNKTRVEFVLPAFLVEGYNLYIEYEDVYGGYDTTERLIAEENIVGVLLPQAWTQYGGEATLRLVASKDDEVGYSLAVRVRYHSRTGVMEKAQKLFDVCIQGIITRINQILLDFEAKLASGELKGDKGDVGDVSLVDDLELVIDGGDAGGTVEITYADRVIEQGTDGIWTYRKWASGVAECWGTETISFTPNKVWGSVYTENETDPSKPNYNGVKLKIVECPSGLFTTVTSSAVNLCEWGHLVQTCRFGCDDTGVITYFPVSFTKQDDVLYPVFAHYTVLGRWKE